MHIVVNGKRLNVETDGLTEDESYALNVALVTGKYILLDDDYGLKDVWVASFQRHIPAQSDGYEFDHEKTYDHEPSEDELLTEMGRSKMGRLDIVSVDKCKQLDWLNDE